MKKSYMDASSPLLRAYFGSEEAIKGKSPLTINEYFLDIRSFFRFYKYRHGLAGDITDLKNIDILDVDENMCRNVVYSDILEFMTYAASEMKNSISSCSRKCSSLRSFFGYLTDMDIIKKNPTEKFTVNSRGSSLPRFLSLDQSIDLLGAVSGDFKERDYCIITLFLNCGMRLSELVGINYSDLLSENRLLLRGKGSKERIIYLNDACVSAIDAYKRVRPVDGVVDKDALFLSRLKRRISPKTVQWLVKKYLGDIGLGNKGYSVHKLRHTAATLMYDSGQVDILAIKDILGHSDLGTTQIYTHVSDNRMRSAADANPLSKVRPPKPDPEKNASSTDDDGNGE